jgi:hypothetical protein
MRGERNDRDLQLEALAGRVVEAWREAPLAARGDDGPVLEVPVDIADQGIEHEIAQEPVPRRPQWLGPADPDGRRRNRAQRLSHRAPAVTGALPAGTGQHPDVGQQLVAEDQRLVAREHAPADDPVGCRAPHRTHGQLQAGCR